MAKQKDFFKHLDFAIGVMIPFVVTGGIATALSFVVTKQLNKTANDILTSLASTSMNFMWPAVAGGMAYSLGGRTALVAGCVSGAVAEQMHTSFIGAIVGGLCAGLISRWLTKHLTIRQTLHTLKDSIIVPLLSTVFTIAIVTLALATPMQALNALLNGFLAWLTARGGPWLGVVIGMMMIIDLAGPIGKTAYFFGVASLAHLQTGETSIVMGCVMIAGMVPPLIMALVMTVCPAGFDADSRNGRFSLWVLGATFVTESVIPYAIKDLWRVMPGFLVGCAVAGGLAATWGCGIAVPHGGMFAFLIPGAITHAIQYLLALVSGVLAGSLITVGLMRKGRVSIENA